MTGPAVTQPEAPESPPRNPYEPYRSLLLTPRRVRELSALRPGRAVRDALICWAFILASWTACALWTEWWVVVPAMLVIGNRAYGLFILGHDGFHRALFPGQKVNDLWSDLMIWAPMGAITHVNNKNHLIHHRLLARPGDPDRHRYCCVGKATGPRLLAFVTGFTTVLPSVRNVFAQGVRDTVRRDPASKGDAYRPRDLAFLLGWFAVLVTGLTWAIGWWAYPVLWVLPVYVFTFLADNLRAFLEHSHPEADDKADQHRMITYVSNPLERLLIAPFHMNFHTVHHLWPSIPYYNLPQADREIRGQEGARGLEWRGSYLAYLLRYLGALPLRECLPESAAGGVR